MEAEITSYDKEIKVKRIDKVDGKKVTTSSIAMTKDGIILEQSKNHPHS